MISRSKTSKTYVQVLMASATCGVVSDRKSVFGFESSLDASIFFAIFCGAIILKETKLSYLLQEKSMSSTLDKNC
jgi:hypothetical protein